MKLTTNPPPNALPPAAGSDEHPRKPMVAEAAYYLAEKRGFAPGREFEDWLQAEDAIEALTRADE